MKRSLIFLAVNLAVAPISLFAGGLGPEPGYAPAKANGKPVAPLKISIAPASPTLAPADIRPGDAVELKIVGRSFVDAAEMTINVQLRGGVTLVSGDTKWVGPAVNGEEQPVLITVRVPDHGNGSVMAGISLSPSPGSSFAAQAEYRFGKHSEKNSLRLPPEIKKDNKGRAIREYRTN